MKKNVNEGFLIFELHFICKTSIIWATLPVYIIQLGIYLEMIVKVKKKKLKVPIFMLKILIHIKKLHVC